MSEDNSSAASVAKRNIINDIVSHLLDNPAHLSDQHHEHLIPGAYFKTVTMLDPAQGKLMDRSALLQALDRAKRDGSPNTHPAWLSLLDMIEQFPDTLYGAISATLGRYRANLNDSILHTNTSAFPLFDLSFKNMVTRTAFQWTLETEARYRTLNDAISTTFTQGNLCMLLGKLEKMALEMSTTSPLQRGVVFNPGMIGHDLQDV
ncbi:hypothetical protein PMZ80_004883 [Knufia obscura]|uniref:Uncharacterized protein n=1 Tax=Knufia obscura TaxID=1635080 RepID=A0ABR0RPV7_9EURO|nr:hypothetical protein PMZ80_004883 [Knufia obscura]